MIFDAHFSVRERPDFSAGFSHQAVVFWSAFFDAGFSSSWAKRGEIASDGEQPMAEKLKIWFDAEADFLEVRFSDAPGYFRETPNINLMERVDEQGNILGFAVEGVSQLKPGQPLEAELVHA